jgi:two-component system cell cycle response regulator DivK
VLLLIVDDFSDGREMLSEYLQFSGFHVVEAVDGAEAIDVASKVQPRIILMDLTMPGLDGWEATRRLKADPRTKDIIILAVTANVLKGEEERARAAGCDGFIAKPFDLHALAETLRRVARAGASALPGPPGPKTDAPRYGESL